MAEFKEAPAILIDLADELIEQWHPHLKEARIGFVLRDESQTSKGKEVYGGAGTVPDKYKPQLDDLEFYIWIAKPALNWQPERLRDLLDHELYHCTFNANTGNPMIRPHDIEEFHVIIERHGFWNQDLFELQRNMEKQLKLPISEVPRTGKVVAINPMALDGMD